MKVFLITQDINPGYKAAVVVAPNAAAAKCMHPRGEHGWDLAPGEWCPLPSYAEAKYLGEAAPGLSGVICTSRKELD